MNTRHTAVPQLELTLKSDAPPRRRKKVSVRRQRANWWFQEMHRVVDEAIEWAARPAGPREQTLVVNARQ